MRIRRMTIPRLTVPLLVLAGACAKPAPTPQPPTHEEIVARGRYLVGFGSCDDCHTPKVMTPQGPVPDTTRRLSGHPASEQVAPIPRGALTPTGWAAMTNGNLTAWAGPWGVSFAKNLTPSNTGLSGWTDSLFIATMRTGRHMGSGRALLPPMPWFSLNVLTDDDLRAVFAFLQSLPPIDNQVPEPLPPAAGGR